MSSKITFNRLVTLVPITAGVGAVVAGIAQAFPHSPTANVCLIIGGFVTKIIAVVNFQRGSQKYDALQADVKSPADILTDQEEFAALPDEGAPVTTGIPDSAAKPDPVPGDPT